MDFHSSSAPERSNSAKISNCIGVASFQNQEMNAPGFQLMELIVSEFKKEKRKYRLLKMFELNTIEFETLNSPVLPYQTIILSSDQVPQNKNNELSKRFMIQLLLSCKRMLSFPLLSLALGNQCRHRPRHLIGCPNLMTFLM